MEWVRKYTYKFIVEGSVVKEETLDYGSTIEYPADPTKEGTDEFTYVFKEWDNDATTLLKDEEFKKFIGVEKDIKWICLFKVLYYCGLRRGELRGLAWKNINFEKRTLSVVQNVVNVSGDHGYWQITTPKTRTSTRTIPIPEKVCKDLFKYKQV